MNGCLFFIYFNHGRNNTRGAQALPNIMAKTLAKVFGWVFILVGVLGFFGNPIVGAMGYFHANIAHDFVHILLGVVLLVTSSTEDKAALWLKIVGVVYLVIAILGFLITPAMGIANLLGFVEINHADNWLHVVLGIVILLAGFADGMMTDSRSRVQM
jgi:uncharacterized membrane protein